MRKNFSIRFSQLFRNLKGRKQNNIHKLNKQVLKHQRRAKLRNRLGVETKVGFHISGESPDGRMEIGVTKGMEKERKVSLQGKTVLQRKGARGGGQKPHTSRRWGDRTKCIKVARKVLNSFL